MDTCTKGAPTPKAQGTLHRGCGKIVRTGRSESVL